MKFITLTRLSILIALTTAIQLPTHEPHCSNHTHASHSNHTRVSTYTPIPTTMLTLLGGVFVQTTMPAITQTAD
ncbi:uncharacterized protein EAF02_004465 [Botrytis sinoallii]|uniref:uncharacterized protein n=1 Tax=Botrytis sinoallii TaxID=1463999 RepID=UPI001900E8D3|nr:uncharacterized protein EAF02_004465 [Botrytis sinoallii]KAF7885956.1 hypothetical protein EAF02_004465 [Botrytis sinoallii]